MIMALIVSSITSLCGNGEREKNDGGTKETERNEKEMEAKHLKRKEKREKIKR